MVDALSDFYRIRHAHYRLWEQQTTDADEEEAHPMEREFTPPTKAMLQQLSQMKASGDQARRALITRGGLLTPPL